MGLTAAGCDNQGEGMTRNGGLIGGAESYRWTFGRAVFDEGRWELGLDGRPVELERKPLEVLQYLLRHAGEAVTKQELLSSVWAGRVVVEAVLTNAVGKLRRALGEKTGALVVTLPTVGYRLDGEVTWSVSALLPPGSRLVEGAIVPRRRNWVLAEALARSGDGEVWLARHAKTGDARVFKFSLDGVRLNGLKREVTVGRLLERALDERRGFVKLIDWDFEQAPYFVEFEYGGFALDRWQGADGRGIVALPLETRLALFCEAAVAVASAHEVGVLHKDLKPANLLVEGDAEALVLRVADFGSSGVFEPGLLEGLGITRLGLTQPLAASSGEGTHLYIAPEVIAGQVPNVRSDIYALGVTLYQLVVGDFRRALAPGWERDVGDPLLRQDIASFANGDPARRPASAMELAVRVRNLEERRKKLALEDAVRARVAEGEKRLERVRARRPWMIAALLLLGVGLAATGLSLHGLLEAERVATEQRDRAEKHARRSEAVKLYLSNDLIRSVTPEGAGYEDDPTIREMIEYASANVDANFGDDPATRGGLHAALAASWAALFNSRRSADHYRKAVAAYAEAFGDADELTVLARYDLVRQLARIEEYEAAHQVLDETDRLAGKRLEQEGRLALWAAWSRGALAASELDPAEAEPPLLRAQALLASVETGRESVATSIKLLLAGVWQRQGKFTEVIEMLREALADPGLGGEEVRNTYRSTLAKVLTLQRKDDASMAEALALGLEAAESTERMQGKDAHATLIRYAEVARTHARSGNCDQALGIYRRVWTTGVARYGLRSQQNLANGGLLAGMEYRCGDPDAGAALERQVLAAYEEHFPDAALRHAATFTAAVRRIDRERFAEADALLAGIDAKKLAASTSSPGARFWIQAQRGRSLIGLGQRERGQRQIAMALDGLVGMGINSEAPGLVALRQLLEE